ncbi:MAG: BrnT family toxin [Deltaproteobacteria bacterium]|nr:MAG: BrnT family toxin [Deltaproteobacteria bacterium]
MNKYQFDWDPEKNLENIKKHGISFESSIDIWRNNTIEIEGVAYFKGEERKGCVGLIDGKVYLAIWTFREGKIRIISVRRARKNEEKRYYQKELQECSGNG